MEYVVPIYLPNASCDVTLLDIRRYFHLPRDTILAYSPYTSRVVLYSFYLLGRHSMASSNRQQPFISDLVFPMQNWPYGTSNGNAPVAWLTSIIPAVLSYHRPAFVVTRLFSKRPLYFLIRTGMDAIVRFALGGLVVLAFQLLEFMCLLVFDQDSGFRIGDWGLGGRGKTKVKTPWWNKAIGWNRCFLFSVQGGSPSPSSLYAPSILPHEL